MQGAVCFCVCAHKLELFSVSFCSSAEGVREPPLPDLTIVRGFRAVCEVPGAAHGYGCEHQYLHGTWDTALRETEKSTLKKKAATVHATTTKTASARVSQGRSKCAAARCNSALDHHFMITEPVSLRRDRNAHAAATTLSTITSTRSWPPLVSPPSTLSELRSPSPVPRHAFLLL